MEENIKTYLLIAVGYIILPKIILFYSEQKGIPKNRLWVLSALPLLIIGIVTTTFGLLKGDFESVFGSIFAVLLLYLGLFPFLFLGSFLYLNFAFDFRFKMRMGFAYSLGFVISISYIIVFGSVDRIFDERSLIFISSLSGVLSALLDYWIWDREQRGA